MFNIHVVVVILLSVISGSAFAGVGIPVPDQEAVESASQEITSIFQDEMKAMTSHVQHSAFAKKVFKIANETEDSASKFVLLKLAVSQACLAGDCSKAFSYSRSFNEEFVVDEVNERFDVLSALESHLTLQGQLYLFVREGIELSLIAAENLNFEVAQKSLVLSELISRKLNTQEYSRKCANLRRKMTSQQNEYELVKEAIERSLDNMSDAKTNETVGLFFCLIMEQWGRGMEFLLTSENLRCEKIAASEFSNPTSTSEVLELANQWWDLSEELQGEYRSAAKQRAASWYRECANDLDGLSKARVDLRLGKVKEIRELVRIERKVAVQKTSSPGTLLKLIKTQEVHTAAVHSLAIDSSGKRLFSASSDGSLRIWNTSDWSEEFVFHASDDQLNIVAIDPITNRVATAGLLGKIYLLSKDGKLLTTISTNEKNIRSLLFSSNGLRLVSGGDGQQLKVWELPSKKLLQKHPLPHNAWEFASTYDDQKIAIALADYSLAVWLLKPIQQERTFKGHTGQVRACAISPDGDLFATGSVDKTVRLWDTKTGEIIHTIKGHGHWVTSVAFSPDGQHLASGSLDKSVKIWSVESGRLESTLVGHSDRVEDVIFSIDGEQLISTGFDNTIRIWEGGK